MALAYPAAGRAIRRLRSEYRWPFYLGGYALLALGLVAALVGVHEYAALVRPLKPLVLAAYLGLTALVFVLVNLVVDLLQLWIDPRLRAAGRGAEVRA